ncbi:MAG TPA: TetR/AcrR family transcriptional regulator [Chloroflexota bacterium]|nr:TetR/AcrR family transcriptional regulator [Chloroflexota bacterium]
MQFIDTALEAFATHGFDGTSVKDLAEAAGATQGLLYHYFPSKDALLEAALERHYFLPELRRTAAPDRDRPAAEVLLELARGFARILDEHRALVQLMMREAPSNAAVRERLERGREEGVRLVANYLATRVEAGELRPHDCEHSARLLFYAALAAHLASTPSEPFLASTVDTLLHGLLA